MDAESNPQLTLGEFLKRAREKKNWTVEHVAEQLKLKISTVKALEADQHSEVGNMVYVKGYLRSYARLLNVNIDQALIDLHSSDESHCPVDVQTAKKIPHTSRLPRFKIKKDRLNLWTSGLVLVLLVILAFAWHHHHKRQKEVIAETAILTAKPKPVELPKISISTHEDSITPLERHEAKKDETHPVQKKEESLPPPVLNDKNSNEE